MVNDKNIDFMELVFEGLNISVIKKNIFDLLVTFMNDLKIPIRKTLIIYLINDITIKEFMNLKTLKNNKKEYDNAVEKITNKIMTKYLEKLRR